MAPNTHFVARNVNLSFQELRSITLWLHCERKKWVSPIKKWAFDPRRCFWGKMAIFFKIDRHFFYMNESVIWFFMVTGKGYEGFMRKKGLLTPKTIKLQKTVFLNEKKSLIFLFRTIKSSGNTSRGFVSSQKKIRPIG